MAPVGQASMQRCASAALIERRRVGRKLEVGDDDRQEDPGPELALITQVFLPIQPRPA